MARTAPAPARRIAAPPPPAEPEGTVYDELWNVIREANPKFPEQRDKEPDQDYFKRIVRDVAAVPLPAWNSMSTQAQEWYDNAVVEMGENRDVTPPPGYLDEGEEATAEEATGEDGEEGVEGEEPAEETAEEPAEEQTPREAARQRMIAFNEKRRAEKSNGTPAPTPQRRGAPAAPVATTPAPRRGAPPAAATPASRPVSVGIRRPPSPAAPARRGAPAASTPRKASEPAGPSNMEVIRQLIVENPSINTDAIIAYMTEQGLVNERFTASRSTINGVLTTTRATIQTIKDMGYWRDPE